MTNFALGEGGGGERETEQHHVEEGKSVIIAKKRGDVSDCSPPLLSKTFYWGFNVLGKFLTTCHCGYIDGSCTVIM